MDTKARRTGSEEVGRMFRSNALSRRELARGREGGRETLNVVECFAEVEELVLRQKVGRNSAGCKELGGEFESKTWIVHQSGHGGL